MAHSRRACLLGVIVGFIPTPKPCLRGERRDFSKVLGIRIVAVGLALHDRVCMPGQDAADCMYGIMPAQAFTHEPLDGLLNRDGSPLGDLILNDGMEDGMELGVREANTRAPVILLRQLNPLYLVK